jgi:hypothetical protein
VTLVPPGKPAQIQTMKFKKKKGGDICQAIAFVLIA